MRKLTIFERSIAGVLACSLLVAVTAFAVQYVGILPLTYKVLATEVTCNTTAAALPGTPMLGRNSVAIRLENVTDTVYIGGSTVTSAAGWILDSNLPAITMDCDETAQVYCITASGSIGVKVLEAK